MQPPTARFYDASLDEKALYERDVNLRIGFRFLNDLLKQYRHDYELALLAYNRGPGRVNQIVADGGDPSNGYENAVLRGYQPKRVTKEMQAQARELGSWGRKHGRGGERAAVGRNPGRRSCIRTGL